MERQNHKLEHVERLKDKPKRYFPLPTTPISQCTLNHSHLFLSLKLFLSPAASSFN